MRRVLMIAPYFPPRRRVGALRAFKFAAHLREFGWAPTVVCLDTPGETLTPRESDLLQGVELVRLSSPVDRTRGGASSSDQSSGGAPSRRGSSSGLSCLSRQIGAQVTAAVDRSFPYDTWLPVLMSHFPAIRRLTEARAFDAVWSTADPWSSHELARQVAATAHLPWVADFRDPWTLCSVRTRQRSAPARLLDRALELRVFSAADHVTFTCESASARYREHYRAQGTPVSTVYNAYDRGLLAADGAYASTPADGSRSEHYRILFLGRFRPLSDARAIQDVLVELRRRSPPLFARVRVVSVGPLLGADLERARSLDLLDAFETIAPVPYESVAGLMRDADLLLVSATEGRDDMIPAKLWDYLTAQRPIMSLAPNIEISDILWETGGGLHFGPNETRWAANYLGRAVAAQRDGRPGPFPCAGPLSDASLRTLAHDARHTAGQLASILDEVAGTAAPVSEWMPALERIS